ncbi:MAG: A/G-specific adenine glycosylase [Nocardioidaceae bacterium]|nr:A/G-specific adenine glycosylase [Nocardioidaceae bacterium]
MPTSVAHQQVLEWYADHRRLLPWREPGIGGWAVLVSEVMLQQTPVARVLPVYEAWMRRWPTASALAADTPGQAVRGWGRLGYPRRALRLHAAATVIDGEHTGVVPAAYDELRRLPGVGDYTAAAVAAFAYRQRAIVLDTNVRRVLARWRTGVQFPPRHVTATERARAEEVLPTDGDVAATWSVALMEVGALLCTATSPACAPCPVRDSCAWRVAGYPAYDGPPRRVQSYAGTDRQCRGRILALLRDSDEPIPAAAVTSVWDDAVQRQRALDSLLEDGLVVENDETLALP